MESSTFVYVTYIRTSADKLWSALTSADFMRQYWFGMHCESDWKPGSPWKLVFPDGRVADSGEVLEFDPPNRLAMKWRNEFKPELKEEGYSHCIMELAKDGDVMKLTITHSIERENAKIIEAVSGGWPKVLSNLKTLLETGERLPPMAPK